MHRLGVYRIRLSKQIFLRTPGSRSLRWAVTEIYGEGDGEGRFTRFVSRTLINQSYDCQRMTVYNFAGLLYNNISYDIYCLVWHTS